MSYEKPTRRQPRVNLLSRDATRELTNSLPLGEGEREIEFVVAVRRDGDLDYYIPNVDTLNIGSQLVQIDTCNGLCFSYEVSKDPCQGGNQFIVENGFTKKAVPCDEAIVKKLTTGRIVKELHSVAFTIYENSGCACSSGSCLHT